MAILMCFWLMVVLIILVELGVFSKSKFVAFGPRDDLMFMHVSIDTYYKYYMLIVMIIFHTFITDLIADSLVPHVLNVVQDTKNRYIPHKARTYLLITTAWSIYCSVTQLFVIFIAFGQLDLLLVRLASDLIANFFTLNMYLDGKIYDPDLHAKNMTSNSTIIKGKKPFNYTINEDDDDDDDGVKLDDLRDSKNHANDEQVKAVYFRNKKSNEQDDVEDEKVELIFEDPCNDHDNETISGAKETKNDEKVALLSK